jgi:hypothetical protein
MHNEGEARKYADIDQGHSDVSNVINDIPGDK